jgi:predicted 3-demethylubiquinone-9 3-methyltransferase (glyoxalase superfamily)
MPKITPFLWFDSQAEEAANFYVSVFPNSRIKTVARYPEGSPGKPGSVMTVELVLDGQEVIALNGGPHFKLTEAFSFSIDCKDQKEVDYYWEKLVAGGGEHSHCGWLKDRFGLSWQVTPTILSELAYGPDKQKAKRAFDAMLKMTKIDIATLKKALESQL